MDTENLKHLEFVQNIITRMNTNSFSIKSWSVTLVSALLAMYAITKIEYFILLGMLPVLVFWLLDTYYLTMERRFRGLYDDVAGIKENVKDIKLFSMNINPYNKGKYSYFNVLFSQTIWIMYIPLMLFLAFLYLYIQCILR